MIIAHYCVTIVPQLCHYVATWIPLVVIYISIWNHKIGIVLQMDGYYGAATWSLIKY
jgi:hypothetical protein